MSDNSKRPRVEGNRVYLICTVCGADTQNSLMLGQRRTGAYSKSPSKRVLETWFELHEKCGGTRDHFKLGLSATPDWDAEVVVSPDSHVGAAVKLALVKS